MKPRNTRSTRKQNVHPLRLHSVCSVYSVVFAALKDLK